MFIFPSLVHAKSLQSCPTLCDPMDCSPPHSSVHGIFQQEYGRRLPFLPPGDLPNPGIKPTSLASPALAGGFFTTSATWKAPVELNSVQNYFKSLQKRCIKHCVLKCLICQHESFFGVQICEVEIEESLLGDSLGKESTCKAGDLGLIPGSGRFPWRREWLSTPVLLPREFQGQRSLAGYSS